MLEKTPNGLAGVLQIFGDYTKPDFEEKHIKSFGLPYPLFYAGKPVLHARAHELLVDNFISVFEKIREAGLAEEVKNYGGIYQVRTKRGLSKPSSHCWGIAIDLEPQKFPLGSLDRFNPEVIKIFNDAGFFYGGDYQGRKDPMHFQFCIGY